MSTMLQHMILFYKLGGKQLYYFNTNDGQGEIDVSKMMATEELPELSEEEFCESCTI